MDNKLVLTACLPVGREAKGRFQKKNNGIFHFKTPNYVLVIIVIGLFDSC